jgi:hypothetical protein
VEPGPDALAIGCRVAELSHNAIYVRDLLPAAFLPRPYLPWRPLQQIAEDLQNPFGRVCTGVRHLVLYPGEVELAHRQLAFGTDGLLGAIEGVLTTWELGTIRALLVERISYKGRGLAAVPIELVDDWTTMDLAVSSRELEFRTP